VRDICLMRHMLTIGSCNARDKKGEGDSGRGTLAQQVDARRTKQPI